jgi:cell division cycle 20-like protein 1 (cofactor of APC complex)
MEEVVTEKDTAPTFSSSPTVPIYVSNSSLAETSPSSWTVTPRRPTKRSKADFGVSDRFIPNRATSNFNVNLWEGITRRSSASRTGSDSSSRDDRDDRNSNSDSGGDIGTSSFNPMNSVAAASQQALLITLLRSELLGENDIPAHYSATGSSTSSRTRGASSREDVNHFRFRSPRQAFQENVFEDAVGPGTAVNSFSLTPVGSAASQRLMAVPPKRKRRISKVPFKVLDAPALQDDFYLNLVDWSSQNVLAVGLGACVYLWSACTSKVTKLCDLASAEDIVTSVSWAQRGTHLGVGTNKGEVQLWDTVKCKKVRSMPGHTGRVGTLAWTGPTLASGSRDRLIYLRDVRQQASYTEKLTNHKQEVCGLKWSFEEPAFLASGGNDNHLHVIDSRNPSEPVHKFAEHTAAVKAIAWSPHQHGLLASGGGTADRCIRFWNTLSGSSLNKVDTGSQVCNLAWSQNCNEIVSTHGYSLNQIVVWRYPTMSKVITLTGHTYRVLYLAMSPDGSTVVTGAGDETLRFWQIFPGPRSDGKDGAGGLLFPNTRGSVIR